MKIELIDLKQQYRHIHDAIHNRMHSVQEMLKVHTIPTTVQSIPLQFGAHFSLPSLPVGFLPISEMALPSLVSLPMHSYLDDTQQQAMCEFVSAATGNVPVAGPLVS